MIKIFSYPSEKSPYLKAFYRSLAPYGFKWCGEILPRWGWWRNPFADYDVFHINWPEYLWRSRFWGVGFLKTTLFFYKLIQAQKAHKTILLTLHNILPHDAQNTAIDIFLMIKLCRESDLVISHSQWAADEAIQKLKCDPGKIIIMPHGADMTHERYPSPKPRAEVCRQYGFNEQDPIVGCMGSLRPYKGADVLLNAFKSEKKTQLLVAGRPFPGFEKKTIAACGGTFGPTTKVIFRELSGQEFSDLMNACSMIVLPYRDITGSGVLLTALSFGKPILASNLPYFREILNPEPKAFMVYESGDNEGLKKAIETMLAINLNEASQAALRLAERYRWEKVITNAAERLMRCVEGRKRSQCPA